MIARSFPRPLAAAGTSALVMAPALVMPVAILALITLMVLPIPPLMLDAFFVLNIALSVAVLMAALNATRPLDFSAFPSVLLFATLLRLALNVASTRIVLVNGHNGGAAAGQVIESFGAFLVGGNFAVGLFVFIILLIINMVVITKGAGRVSEVSARFTLDALPGKQMAIDADIAAGLLTPDEAKARRSEVATEADFYGAMDGTSKFVKGDAIAAMLILAVNLIAGFALGMLSHDLTAGEAAETYVTLAVGDALVAQVPALLLSIAAAAMVTRVADSRDLVGQIGGQFADPRAWAPVAIVLGAVGLIPAMPQTVFLPAAALTGWLWWHLRQRKAAAGAANDTRQEPARPDRIELEDVSDHTLVTLELGYALAPLVETTGDAALVARVTGVRRQLSQKLGFVVPPLRIRDSMDLPPDEYRLLLGGVPIARSTARAGRVLAIDTGEAAGHEALQGEATTDPSFGCPARWIAARDRETAIANGWLAVDPGTVIATHLSQALSARGADLLGTEETRTILEAVRERAPGLAEAISPEPLPLAALMRLLRALVADGFSLAHPVPLFSSLALALQQTQEFDALVDSIRADLGASLLADHCPPETTLAVATLDAGLESAILGGVVDPSSGQPLIEPDCAALIGREVARLAQSHAPLALIVQPPARRALARLLAQHAPQVPVFSIAELPVTQRVEVVAAIGQAPAADETPAALDAPGETAIAGEGGS